MLTQLEPTIPVETAKGRGYAFAVIDYGQEHHLLWVVAMDETGEIWSIPNPEVKVQRNWSMGRLT
jgi:deoxyxylulose-5-phosphate synthase